MSAFAGLFSGKAGELPQPIHDPDIPRMPPGLPRETTINSEGITMRQHYFDWSALRPVAAAVLALACGAQARAGLVNPGFESYAQPAGTFGFRTDTNYPGWRTTETDHLIEVWGTGFNGVPAYEGSNFVELNAFEVSTLYQDVAAVSAGSLLDFHFAHRGRAGVDTMSLTITDLGADNAFGGGDDTVLYTNVYSDGNTAWGYYTNPAPLVALGNGIRFAYQSVSAAGGNSAVGNFLDAADFGVDVNGGTVPEPSSFALGVLGMAGLGFSRRRRRGR
jgi:hypothetical protein